MSPYSTGNNAWLSQALATSSYGSWLRVVGAPSGSSTGLELSFTVEGVLSAGSISLEVHNADDPTGAFVNPALQCAYLEIVSSPSKIIVTGTSLARSSAPFDRPFSVVAYNTFGDPVATPNVSMFLYDAAGIHVYQSTLRRIWGHNIGNYALLSSLFLLLHSWLQ